MTILDAQSTVLFNVYAGIFSSATRKPLTSPPSLLFANVKRYGGPSSQLVSASFDLSWHAYLACGLQYVIVTVDGRYGYKGRACGTPSRATLDFGRCGPDQRCTVSYQVSVTFFCYDS